MKAPELKVRLLVMLVAWFSASFVYYGFYMVSGNLGGGLYVSFFLSALVEVPAYAMAYYGMEKYGLVATCTRIYVIAMVYLY